MCFAMLDLERISAATAAIYLDSKARLKTQFGTLSDSKLAILARFGTVMHNLAATE
jgi:hypothetical protein